MKTKEKLINDLPGWEHIKELYRYEDVTYHPGIDEFGDPLLGLGRTSVNLLKFKITKFTPKGVWIGEYGVNKFINLRARKRYACPTLHEAMESFIARKNKQIKILGGQLKRAETALSIALEMVKQEQI